MELGGGCVVEVVWWKWWREWCRKWCGVVLWRAGGALVNAVAALGEGTCSGVLSVGVCKSLILQGFSML
ncbi:hypothetical protein HMPREF3230_00888 [Gardnerella vaginalis]|uniref:Uncharacterized protein n=1 Tax=Gardnerella vaginalis TaxID=2702 RepID=A0A135Z4Y7_GARVA|nr:hypothetical protein [Gardnerella vaginalis]KXI16730.1 hypothetical protein HMPREF3230_00888 [Gardnerella vaginalis]